MAKLFGTSGARGVTNRDITPLLALKIGLIYGRMCVARKRGKQAVLLVGNDNRYGAEMLAHAVIAGLNAAGAHVEWIGCVSTGVYSVNLRERRQFDGGILITGSHMPPDRIGIIPMLPNAHYADRDVTEEIERELAVFSFPECLAAFETVGGSYRIIEPGCYFGGVSRMLGAAGVQVVRAAQFRVLIDPANGTAGAVAKEFLENLGCVVEMINGARLPIPQRPAECKPETCEEAIARMRDGGFHLGACFDGDADRVLFITPDGSTPTDDQIGAMFAAYLLREGDALVTPVNASRLIEAVCRPRGVRVKYCRIGQPATDTAVRQHGAKFAYESAARKYGFHEFECCYDGVYAMAKLLALMARTGKSLCKLVGELPPFFQSALRLEVPDEQKGAVAERVIAALGDRLEGEIEEVLTVDGVRFMLRGDASVHVRQSGTEPVVRVYSDARSQAEADALTALARGAFEKALS